MKISANDVCPCGSGVKFKKCCRNRVFVIGEDASTPEHAKVEAVRPSLLKTGQEPQLIPPGIPSLSSKQKALSLLETKQTLNHTEASYKLQQIKDFAPAVIEGELSGQLYPLPTLHWEPLGDALPYRYLKRHMQKRVLPVQHQQFFAGVNALIKSGKPGLVEALRCLNTIPNQEAICLPWALDARGYVLRALGREQEFHSYMVDVLLTWESEELWWSYGNLCLPWLQHYAEPEEEQVLLEKLEVMYQHTSLAGPRLVLAYRLRGRDNCKEKVHTLYREALEVSRWPWYGLSSKERKKQAAMLQRSTGWLPVIGDALFAMLCDSVECENNEDFNHWIELLFRYPWERYSVGREGMLLDTLCQNLSSLGLYKEIQRLCEHGPNRVFPQSIRAYWLGRVVAERGQTERAKAYFAQASQETHSLRDQAILQMANFYAYHQEVERCRALLEAYQDKEAAEYVRLLEWCQANSQSAEILRSQNES